MSGTATSVVTTDREIVVLGIPSQTEDENAPDYHNCDVMGCGLDHVIFRAIRAAVAAAEKEVQ